MDKTEDKLEKSVDGAVCGSEVNFSSMMKASGGEEYTRWQVLLADLDHEVDCVYLQSMQLHEKVPDVLSE